MTVKKFFTKLAKRWDKAKLLWFLHKEIVVHLYKAVRKQSNVTVGIGWVERKDPKDFSDQGVVKTQITYYNMAAYDVYHAFWHMCKRYGDEVEKLREGKPLQIDDNTGRWYKYVVNLEIDEENKE